MSVSVTGEQLYAELCDAAAQQGKSLAAYVSPLFHGASWKIEQLRIAKVPTAFTIQRVRALIAGQPLPQRKLDVRHLQMKRADAEDAGIPPSGRAVYEKHLLERAEKAKARVALLRELSEQAKASRAPGQTLQARLQELQLEFGA